MNRTAHSTATRVAALSAAPLSAAPLSAAPLSATHASTATADAASATTTPSHATPLQAIAGFAASLRDHGLKVGVPEQQAMVNAALRLPLAQSHQLDAAWRAIACQDVRDWRAWPELFERYWHPQRLKGQVKVSGQTRPSRNLQQLVQALHQQLDAAANGRPAASNTATDTALQPADASQAADPPGPARAQGGASATDPLHDRALSLWLPQDLAQLERLAQRIAQALRRRLTRRWRSHDSGRRLDVRRTLRASLRTGGVPVHPVWRSRQREQPRLFLLVDVSRSMETHAQLFLRIARAFVGVLNARVFVFHTRLAEVTPLMRGDSTRVQEKINAVTAGFGGGTRIATSIDDFSGVHARAQLGRNARVWILSDGFDADPPEALALALARVRARGARLHWFHPSEDRPASQAMQAVAARRGLIERFDRLNSLRDLAALADHAVRLR